MRLSSKILQHIDGVSIHCVEKIIDQNFPTVLYLPGLSGEGEGGVRHLSPLLSSKMNIAGMSFRGRGRSSTPPVGYSLEDHANDLNLVIHDRCRKKLVLIATSMSAMYAVKYLELFGNEAVSGLIIVDHPLKIARLKSGWAAEYSKMTVNGVSVLSTMRRSALHAVENESVEANLYPRLKESGVSTLVMHPTVPAGITGETDLSAYKSMPRVRTVEFADSDHFIRLREPDKYLSEILKFSG